MNSHKWKSRKIGWYWVKYEGQFHLARWDFIVEKGWILYLGYSIEELKDTDFTWISQRRIKEPSHG